MIEYTLEFTIDGWHILAPSEGVKFVLNCFVLNFKEQRVHK